MFKKVLALFGILLTISACDSKNESNNTHENNCDLTVVSDYNTVINRCNYISTDSDARNCKATAQSFLDKYPNISCKASQSSSTSVDSLTITITTDKFKEIVDKLTLAGY